MEIHERLDDIAQLLETARAVPLSTSCVVPRNEALDLVEDARDALPEAIREADEILANREQLLDDASNEAQQVLSSANAQASDLISGAQHDADRIVDNARADADEMLDRARAEARRMIDEQEVLLRAQEEAAELLELSVVTLICTFSFFVFAQCLLCRGLAHVLAKKLRYRVSICVHSKSSAPAFSAMTPTSI